MDQANRERVVATYSAFCGELPALRMRRSIIGSNNA
jgi:hypothetical protein